MDTKIRKQIVSLSLSEPLIARLKQVAANEEISLSGLMETLSTHWLDTTNPQPDAPALRTNARHRYAKGQLLLGFMHKWKPRKKRSLKK